MKIFQYKDMTHNTFQNGEWGAILVAEIQSETILEADTLFLETMGLKKMPTMIAVAIVKEFSFDVDKQTFDPDAGMSII